VVDGFLTIADDFYAISQEFLDSEKDVKDKEGVS
jgi:hypothetical protein